ncbi:MAG: GIY-YIG nuclease family protein, partial [Gammaproteobacteria bacterium]|nr:GIY-YIG nuclease family protein [Gammaproteobacteria bacterium]
MIKIGSDDTSLLIPRRVLDSALYGTEKCGRNCLTCKFVLDQPFLKSTVTNKKFRSVNNINCTLNCITRKVVYLITCAKCGLQYVGLTACSLAEWLREHRRKIINNDRATYLYQHFCSNNHSIEDLRIQIIEVVDNNSELINREDFWIRVLNTAHPF